MATKRTKTTKRASGERIFVTGGTGFLGGYVLAELLAKPNVHLDLLVRGADDDAITEKLWRALQLHMDAASFAAYLPRMTFVRGDLHAPNLGIDEVTTQRLANEVDSVLHIAASLNRKSAKACLNTNLRGTLSVIKLARRIADTSGLRRYSHVSTVAVAGQRDREDIYEDSAIEWNRSDYDPYARTKKFCEHLAHELLPDVQKTILRPSIVMGDSRFPETAQFDMVRATCFLADLPIIPLRADARLDIVNADWVGHAIASIHLNPAPKHEIYHLSAGLSSRTAGEISEALARAAGKRPARFIPRLQGAFQAAVNGLAAMPGKNSATLVGALMKVFLPYVTYDTVFDNTRAVTEVGRAPIPFTEYGGALYRWAKQANFAYPYRPWTGAPTATAEEAA